MRLVLAFGLAFVLPVVLVALNFAGLVSAATLIGGWRWAVLIAFVFAAVMTPTPTH
ncbi:twin-arginine translocase subunit TatC [Oerskovia sp. M15]